MQPALRTGSTGSTPWFANSQHETIHVAQDLQYSRLQDRSYEVQDNIRNLETITKPKDEEVHLQQAARVLSGPKRSPSRALLGPISCHMPPAYDETWACPSQGQQFGPELRKRLNQQARSDNFEPMSDHQ